MPSRGNNTTVSFINARAASLNHEDMTVEQRLDYLRHEIFELQRRNFEKDRGKEFESSYTRVIFIMVLTYIILACYFNWVLDTGNPPLLDALVPTLGFNIGTWSLPFVKERWIQARHYYMHGESEATSLKRHQEHQEEVAALWSRMSSARKVEIPNDLEKNDSNTTADEDEETKKPVVKNDDEEDENLQDEKV